MSVTKRISELLSENECNGAFNAYEELSGYGYNPKDFTEMRGWVKNGFDTEVVFSEKAMLLFEDGLIIGIAIREEELPSVMDLTVFKTVRGKDSDFTGPLLDGFL